MPEDNNQGGGGAQSGMQGAQGNGGAQSGMQSAGGGAENGSGAGQGGAGSHSGNQEVSETLSQENARRRHENARLTTALSTKETELKDAKDKLAQFEARERDNKISGIVAEAVGKLNSPHAAAIVDLVDRAKITIKEDGTADVATIDSAIAAVKSKHPQLFGGGGAFSRDAGAHGTGDPANANATMNNFIRQGARK